MKDRRATQPQVDKVNESLKNSRFRESASQDAISQTNVNTGSGVWGGRRKVVGIRVDENLYKAFKPVAKAVFGSVCRPIECFMASVVAIANEGVNFGNTVRIEKLNVERNLRPRRRLEADFCGVAGCDEVAVGVGVWRGTLTKQKLFLCEKHLAVAKISRDWSEVRRLQNEGDE